MKGIRSLVRLYGRKLEEKRKILAGLLEQRSEMLLRLSRLEREMQSENQTARTSPDVLYAYAGYCRSAGGRRDVLIHSMSEIDVEIDSAHNIVFQAFREFKKYDIAEENSQRAIRAEEKSKEQRELDDIGISIHRRRRAGLLQ